MDFNFGSGDNKSPNSTSELFGSAKAVSEAAQAAFRGETEKIDKAKAADAAGDLLGAASEYGNLDKEKGLGGYVQKAESYLHQYGSSDSNPPPPKATPPPPADESAGGGGEAAAGLLNTTSDGKPSEEGGGYGEYLKIAEGFLGKK